MAHPTRNKKNEESRSNTDTSSQNQQNQQGQQGQQNPNDLNIPRTPGSGPRRPVTPPGMQPGGPNAANIPGGGPAQPQPQQAQTTGNNAQQTTGSETTSPADTRATDGRKLVIGRDITIDGDISSCDHLVVEGTVKVDLSDAERVDVRESGEFFGSVDIDEATIAGRFEGKIVVAKRLTVTSTGIVVGEIECGEIEVQAGAKIDGQISPLDAVEKSGNAKTGKTTSRNRKSAGKNQDTSQNQMDLEENTNETENRKTG